MTVKLIIEVVVIGVLCGSIGFLLGLAWAGAKQSEKEAEAFHHGWFESLIEIERCLGRRIDVNINDDYDPYRELRNSEIEAQRRRN